MPIAICPCCGRKRKLWNRLDLLIFNFPLTRACAYDPLSFDFNYRGRVEYEGFDVECLELDRSRKKMTTIFCKTFVNLVFAFAERLLLQSEMQPGGWARKRVGPPVVGPSTALAAPWRLRVGRQSTAKSPGPTIALMMSRRKVGCTGPSISKHAERYREIW